MKVLALIGSPRKDGNSSILADEVLFGSKEKGAHIKKIFLDDYLIKPIGEVTDNTRKRMDPRKDDDYFLILQQFLESDIIIWSTPVYWFGVSGQMKCFIDRLSSYFNIETFRDKFTNKGHVVLCTYGSNEKKHGDWVIKPMKEMIKIIRGRFLGEITVDSCYEKGKIREKSEVLKMARDLGRRVII